MEAIILFIILLPELLGIFVLLIPLIIEVLALCLQIIIELIFLWLGKRNTKSQKKKPFKLPRWAKIATWTTLCLLILTVTFAFIMNRFCFDKITDFALTKLENKTGICVSYKNVTGSIWQGSFRLQDAKISRGDDSTSNFELDIKDLDVDISIPDFITHSYVFEKVHITGVQGWYERKQIIEKLDVKDYKVNDLLIEDFQIAFHDLIKDPQLNLTLSLEHLRTDYLNSRSCIFHLLFDSRIKGRIGQSPFSIAKEQTQTSSTSTWKIHDMPLNITSAYLKGPFSWLTNGTLDVDISSFIGSIDQSRPELIKMNTSFNFKNIKAQLPENIGGVKQHIASPVIDYLNSHAQSLPIEFGFELGKDIFDGYASLEAVGLYEIIEDAVLKEICKKASVKEETLKENWRKEVNKLKDFLKGN